MAVDKATQNCRIVLTARGGGSGDADTDFAIRWQALAGAGSPIPLTARSTPELGIKGVFGERVGRTAKGEYRTLALFTITSDQRTQSVAAMANDERCLWPLKALVKTVAVIKGVGDGPAANNGVTTSSGGSADSESAVGARPLPAQAATKPVKRADVVGEWHGLKTVKAFGSTFFLQRSIIFNADGTYVSEEPNTTGRYELSGSTVTLPNLYVFTYENGHMLDSMGVLTRGRFVSK